MNADEKKILTEILPFWKELKEREKNLIFEHTILKKYKDGDNIHGGHEDCTGVIAIKSGRIRAYLLSEEGKEVTLFRLLDNDVCILSAACILRNISFAIYVDAEGPTELYVINSGTYEEIVKENPIVNSFMTDLLSMRFSEAMWVMEQILFMKFDKRLAIFLIDQSNLEGGDTIKLTHEQIAGHMGSAREVVSRMLKYFANEGLIQVSRKGITLLNRKKLLEYL